MGGGEEGRRGGGEEGRRGGEEGRRGGGEEDECSGYQGIGPTGNCGYHQKVRMAFQSV